MRARPRCDPRDNNHKIRYEGDAVLWQGASRLEADTVEIDRESGALKAQGHVVSQLLDQATRFQRPDKAKAESRNRRRPVFTIVRAAGLDYNDKQRIAHYRDGVTLERPDMKVKAREIRAFLRNDSDDSSLDHAFADGKVEIEQTAPGRIRTPHPSTPNTTWMRTKLSWKEGSRSLPTTSAERRKAKN